MKLRALSIAWVLATAMTACGGGSGDTSGGNGGSGAEGGSGGSGESGGNGGSTTTGMTTGAECPTQADGTAANHIIITVSWPETIGLEAGTGEMHVWTKASLTFDGT